MDITVFSVDSLVKLVSEFVEIFGIVGAVTAPLVLIWIWINWRTFYPKAGASDERKARLANDLERRRQWIADRGFEQRYLRLLKGLLGGITRLTHDARSLARSRNTATWPVRWFGLNPFTEGSYLLCLRLALIYPILSAFVVWLLGGEGVLDIFIGGFRWRWRWRFRVYPRPAVLQTRDCPLLARVQSLLYRRSVARARLDLTANE